MPTPKKDNDDVKISVEIGSKTFIKIIIVVGIIVGLLTGNAVVISIVKHYLGIKNNKSVTTVPIKKLTTVTNKIRLDNGKYIYKIVTNR